MFKNFNFKCGIKQQKRFSTHFFSSIKINNLLYPLIHLIILYNKKQFIKKILKYEPNIFILNYERETFLNNIDLSLQSDLHLKYTVKLIEYEEKINFGKRSFLIDKFFHNPERSLYLYFDLLCENKILNNEDIIVINDILFNSIINDTTYSGLFMNYIKTYFNKENFKLKDFQRKKLKKQIVNNLDLQLILDEKMLKPFSNIKTNFYTEKASKIFVNSENKIDINYNINFGLNYLNTIFLEDNEDLDINQLYFFIPEKGFKFGLKDKILENNNFDKLKLISLFLFLYYKFYYTKENIKENDIEIQKQNDENFLVKLLIIKDSIINKNIDLLKKTFSEELFNWYNEYMMKKNNTISTELSIPLSFDVAKNNFNLKTINNIYTKDNNYIILKSFDDCFLFSKLLHIEQLTYSLSNLISFENYFKKGKEIYIDKIFIALLFKNFNILVDCDLDKIYDDNLSYLDKLHLFSFIKKSNFSNLYYFLLINSYNSYSINYSKILKNIILSDINKFIKNFGSKLFPNLLYFTDLKNNSLTYYLYNN